MDAASPFLIDLFLRPFSTSAALEAVATAVSVWPYSSNMAGVAGGSPQTKYQSAFEQRLRHFQGMVAALWSRGEPARSLLLFNQSSAGWVKINDL